MARSKAEKLEKWRELEDHLMDKKLAGEHVVSYSTPSGHRVTRQPVTEALNDVRSNIRDLERVVNEGTRDQGYASGRVVSG